MINKYLTSRLASSYAPVKFLTLKRAMIHEKKGQQETQSAEEICNPAALAKRSLPLKFYFTRGSGVCLACWLGVYGVRGLRVGWAST